MESQLLTTKQTVQQSVDAFEHRTLDRIAASMSEIGTVTNKTEQTLIKLTRVSKPPPPTPPSLHNYNSHTRALEKAEKTILTQDINIKHMNSLHVDLEDTVNLQRETFTTLTRRVDKLD